MPKKIAILQSNYIPWKGYFDLIASVDEFIFYDDMQYTRRDWRNRNKIKTPNGLTWITVPVKVKGQYFQSIKNIEINGSKWVPQHLASFFHNYKKSLYFDEIYCLLESIYNKKEYIYLSDLNTTIITALCEYLGIKTKLTTSSDYTLAPGKTERLVDLCKQANGTEYISGPAAKNYIDESLFEEAGIKLTWFNYEGYPEYPQLWGVFEHTVSIIDLLFNCGKNSPHNMRFVL